VQFGERSLSWCKPQLRGLRTDWSIGGTGEGAGLSSSRIWLDVPYADKDEAKTLGAWWDPYARRWYAPRPGMSALDRWHALPDVPDLLPGEDRDFGSGLFVDLVPSSCWFTNVRSCVSQRDWERLRMMITTRAGRRCEICHRGEDRESGRWLEAHERWDFDHQTKVQALRRLICLCTSCHTATHYGLAKLTGKDSEAFRHICRVTRLPARQVKDQIDLAFAVWQIRSLGTWELDLGILLNAGVTLNRPPASGERLNVAATTLRAL
jgi:Domain of unknown function (DUF5710)